MAFTMIGISELNREIKGQSLFSWIALIFYGVGLTGMIIAPDRFIPLSAMNLLLMVSLLFLDGLTVLKAVVFFLVAALGWGIEWVGVHTGMPFGIYQYGNGLGWKLDDIPLIIGGNWVLMSWVSVESVRWAFPKWTKWNWAWASALIMVIMDVLMEPVAPTLDYWMFQLNWVPIQNYLAWGWLGLIFSFVMTFIPKSKSDFPVLLAGIQFLFFVILNIVF
jgi:putative membrane protein